MRQSNALVTVQLVCAFLMTACGGDDSASDSADDPQEEQRSDGKRREEQPESQAEAEDEGKDEDEDEAKAEAEDKDEAEAEAGKPSQTPSKPAEEDEASRDSAATTYTKHVRPILTRACVNCHSDGQIAPFSLDSYERAKTFAPLIAEATKSRKMPPSVVDNSGACQTFRDLPWLSDDEIATLGRWAEQKAPEGDPDVAAPTLLPLPKLTGDVRSLSTPSYVPSKEKPDDYRCFVLDSPFNEDTFVTGFDTKPGDEKTAHHMVVFYPTDDMQVAMARSMDDMEEGPGYTCFGGSGVIASILAAWAPGAGATLYPDKLGIPVVANRPVIVQMHYNTNGSDMPGADSTQIDFQVEREGISPGVFTTVLNLDLNVEPGKPEVMVESNSTLAARAPQGTESIQIYGVFPHMHELGRRLDLSVNRDGEDACLVDAPRYSFFWQRMYFFDEPVTVGVNDQLSMRCVFDTTSRTEPVTWGEGTQEEMCVVGLFIKR